MSPTTMGGAAEVAIGGVLIPSTMLSEVSVTYKEGTRERTTLGGKYTRSSGVPDEASVVFTLFPDTWDRLKEIFPGKYNAPTAPATTGNFILGANGCAIAESSPVNIHFTCDTTDYRDVFLYKGEPMLTFEFTYTSDNDLSVEVTIMAQPDENGNVMRLGTGDLTAESVYDPATMTTVAAA